MAYDYHSAQRAKATRRYHRTPRDYHSAQRHAQTRFYAPKSRAQIRSLDTFTASGQRASHRAVRQWSHQAWLRKRTATVAKHKARRSAGRVQTTEGGGGDPWRIVDPVLMALLNADDKTARSRGALLWSVRKPAVARSAVAQADALWGIAGKRYRGKQPDLSLGTDSPSTLGEVYADDHNRAHIAAGVAASAAGVNPRARAALDKVLLHEWAHTRQPTKHGRFTQRLSESEGGAEAFARHNMRALGIKDYAKFYAPWVKLVRQKRGPSWVRHGQFKP